MARRIATLAGGCFWCLEAAFDQLRGVVHVESGYTGGSSPDPTYHEVCSGRTGHAEAVQVTFDDDVVSYEQLLDVFFTIHDPTTLNRQGADVGTQYRSAVFFDGAEQEAVARAKLAELGPLFDAPLVTEVAPLRAWYAAEPYHRDYYARNPGQGYCQAVISPKLGKLRQKHAQLLR